MRQWALRHMPSNRFLASCREEKSDVQDVQLTEYPIKALRFDTAADARVFNNRAFKRVGVVTFTEMKIEASLLEE